MFQSKQSTDSFAKLMFFHICGYKLWKKNFEIIIKSSIWQGEIQKKIIEDIDIVFDSLEMTSGSCCMIKKTLRWIISNILINHSLQCHKMNHVIH